MWRNHYYNITSHGNYCKCHKIPGGVSCQCYGGGYPKWHYHPHFFNWYGWPHPYWHEYSWHHYKYPFNPYHKPPYFYH